MTQRESVSHFESLSICLSVALYISYISATCLFACLSLYEPVSLSAPLSICLPSCLPACLTVCVSPSLSVPVCTVPPGPVSVPENNTADVQLVKIDSGDDVALRVSVNPEELFYLKGNALMVKKGLDYEVHYPSRAHLLHAQQHLPSGHFSQLSLSQLRSCSYASAPCCTHLFVCLCVCNSHCPLQP